MFVCNRISKYKNIYTHTYVCKYINYAGKSPEKSYQLDKHGTHTHTKALTTAHQSSNVFIIIANKRSSSNPFA